MLADPAEVRRHLVELLGAPEELGFQHAVHHKIGIASDGAREMAVRRTRKPIVAAVLLAIDRALHRAQHKRRDKPSLGAPVRCGNRLLERVLAPREETHGIDLLEPGELLEDGHELRKPLQVGRLVNAIGAGELRTGKMLGDDLVCPDHHLLDKRRRSILPTKLHALRLSRLIELDTRLGLVEVDAALALALRMSK